VTRCKLLTAVLIFALAPSALYAQPPEPAKKMFSPNLAIVGGVTAAAGLAFLLSTISVTPADPDGDNWKLYNSNYCVTTNPREFNVQRGRCSTGVAGLEESFRPYAIGTTAAGLVMVAAGMHKVTVKEKTVTIKPVFAWDSASVNGSISWGGAK
jgi:hypothetical protein